MDGFRTFRFFACASVVALIVCTQPVRGHGVLIGQDGAGHLHVHVVAPQPLALPLSIFPNVNGWAAPEPGISALEADEPAEGLFMLSPNSNIQFELVSFDPGVRIVTDHVWVAGETYLFGPPVFDYHLVFNIPSGEAGETYDLQFKVRDLAGIYTDSPIITLVFSAGGACHCPGDFEHNHTRNGRDIQPFVHCMIEAEPGHTLEAHCGCADLNGDGQLTGADVSMFVSELLEAHPCH